MVRDATGRREVAAVARPAPGASRPVSSRGRYPAFVRFLRLDADGLASAMSAERPPVLLDVRTAEEYASDEDENSDA